MASTAVKLKLRECLLNKSQRELSNISNSPPELRQWLVSDVSAVNSLIVPHKRTLPNRLDSLSELVKLSVPSAAREKLMLETCCVPWLSEAFKNGGT